MASTAPEFRTSTPGETEPEIRLANLTKRFGEVVAVDDASLTVGAGEFFSLLGPGARCHCRRSHHVPGP